MSEYKTSFVDDCEDEVSFSVEEEATGMIIVRINEEHVYVPTYVFYAMQDNILNFSFVEETEAEDEAPDNEGEDI